MAHSLRRQFFRPSATRKRDTGFAQAGHGLRRNRFCDPPAIEKEKHMKRSLIAVILATLATAAFAEPTLQGDENRVLNAPG